MKKVIIQLVLFEILMFLFITNVTIVSGCSPVIYYDTTIITVHGDEFDTEPEYNYDLLFNKEEYPQYYHNTVNDLFIASYINYDSFTFLEEGDWVSYKAHYSEEVNVWESGWNHWFRSMEENTIKEYKIIVFKDDGEIINISPVYNKDNYGFSDSYEEISSVAHTYDEDAEEFGERAIGNGCSGWQNSIFWMSIVVYGGWGLLIFVLTVIAVYIVRHKKK